MQRFLSPLFHVQAMADLASVGVTHPSNYLQAQRIHNDAIAVIQSRTSATMQGVIKSTRTMHEGLAQARTRRPEISRRHRALPDTCLIYPVFFARRCDK